MTERGIDENPKRRIDVVGAALVRDGRVLAARRSQAMSLAGTWEFPGGKIEAGESPRQALERELHEELICRAEIGLHVDTSEYDYEFGTVVLSVYLCTLIDGEPQITEHDEIRWVSQGEMKDLEWAPADVPAVEVLRTLDLG